MTTPTIQPDTLAAAILALLHFQSDARSDDAAVALLKEYEQWEADIILENECWTGQNVRLTDELYERIIALQTKRNVVLYAAPPAARSASEPVAYRVLCTNNGATGYFYTEQLPFDPGPGVTVRREPEPLYATPPQPGREEATINSDSGAQRPRGESAQTDTAQPVGSPNIFPATASVREAVEVVLYMWQKKLADLEFEKARGNLTDFGESSLSSAREIVRDLSAALAQPGQEAGASSLSSHHQSQQTGE